MESYENALKTNSGWLGLVDRAQSEADRIDRLVRAPRRLRAILPEDIQALSRRYLDPGAAVEVDVLPQGVDLPPQG
jgi:zinc protease